MVTVRPDFWPLRLSTKPSTIPVIITPSFGDPELGPAPVKVKLKLSAGGCSRMETGHQQGNTECGAADQLIEPRWP